MGCLVNEPALLQYSLTVGDVITLRQHINTLTCQVRAAYYDYGEQGLNVVVTTTALLNSSLSYTEYGLSLWLKPNSDVDAIADYIQKQHQLDSQ